MRNLNICKSCPYFKRVPKKSSDRVNVMCTWLDKMPHRREIFKGFSLTASKAQKFSNNEYRQCWMIAEQAGEQEEVRSRVEICKDCSRFTFVSEHAPRYIMRYACRERKEALSTLRESHMSKPFFEIRPAPPQCPYILELLVLKQEIEKEKSE